MSADDSPALGLRLDRLADTVAALDAVVRGNTQRLDSAEQRIGQLDSYSSELAGALAEVLPRVDQLAGAVAAAGGNVGVGGEPGQGSSPVVWALLSADEAAAAWDELARWVETVAVPTLAPSARQVPPCWPMHRWGRETLSWLHHTHREAYGPQGSAFQVAEWHTRWVAQAYAAIDDRDAAPGGYCEVGDHHCERVERAAPLRTEDWGPWLVRARDADVLRRRAQGDRG